MLVLLVMTAIPGPRKMKKVPALVITAFLVFVLTVAGYQKMTSLQVDREPPAVEQTMTTESI